MSRFSAKRDEVNLSFVPNALARYVFVIVCFFAFGLLVSAYYSTQLASKQYEASVRFELSSGQSSGPNFGSLGSAAQLLGVVGSGGSGEAEKLKDRILSRPFVNKIFEAAQLETDLHFNVYIAPPDLLPRVLNFLFDVPYPVASGRDDLLVSSIKQLGKNMQLNIGDNGVIRLTLRHTDPVRAADVANIIVETALDELEEKERRQTRGQLNHFAEELTRIQVELDQAVSAVTLFAIQNGIQSEEDLARTAIQLNRARDEREELSRELGVLRLLASIGVENFDGQSFAKAHPSSLRPTFRRSLSWPNDPREWSFPDEKTLESNLNRAAFRLQEIDENIRLLGEEAVLAGELAKEFLRLERAVAVQTVLQETARAQFETQSLFAGFKEGSGEIIESAIAPRVPVSPRILLSLIMTSTMFALLGSVCVVYYAGSRAIVFSAHDAKALVESSTFVSVKKPWFSVARSRERRLWGYQEVIGSMGESLNTVALVGALPEKRLLEFGLQLGESGVVAGFKTGLVDLSASSRFQNHEAKKILEESFLCKRLTSGVDVLSFASRDSLLSNSAYLQGLEKLNAAYDLLIVCASLSDSGPATILKVVSSANHVVLAAAIPGSRSGDLEKVGSLLNSSGFSKKPLLLGV